MLQAKEKSTLRRLGALCLIAFGMTTMACQPEPVRPRVRVTTGLVTPARTQADSAQANDNKPPIDVDGGKGS